MRHILFGDSIGFGVGDYQYGGWATRLRLFIDQDQQDKSHNLINLSISGDTSRGLLGRLEREAKLRMRGKSPAEFRFLIAIGANDSRVNKDDLQNDISLDEFRTNILKLIKIASKLSSEVVLVGLVPVVESLTTPYKENKHYLVDRIEQYNQVLCEIAVEHKLKMVDMFDHWKTLELEPLFADGLHPNTKGHELIFKAVRDVLIDYA